MLTTSAARKTPPTTPIFRAHNCHQHAPDLRSRSGTPPMASRARLGLASLRVRCGPDLHSPERRPCAAHQHRRVGAGIGTHMHSRHGRVPGNVYIPVLADVSVTPRAFAARRVARASVLWWPPRASRWMLRAGADRRRRDRVCVWQSGRHGRKVVADLFACPRVV
ncbi:hypothetical protein C8J57DRAFT_1308063, partial [Mycena rebaudengoi]